VSGYVLSVEADFDLDDIWDYIAADSMDAADRWIGKLFDTFEALGRTPGMGHRREDLPRSRFSSGPSARTSSFTAPKATPSRSLR
jgi:plasmid stabilization system protein ParE